MCKEYFKTWVNKQTRSVLDKKKSLFFLRGMAVQQWQHKMGKYIECNRKNINKAPNTQH